MEALKTIEINGREYRIGNFSPEIGSWLLMRLMKMLKQYIAKAQQEGVEGNEDQGIVDEHSLEFAETLITQLLTELEFDDFKKVQRYALAVVTRTEVTGNESYQQPVTRPDGTINIFDLKNDVGIVMSLTSQALFANLSPFFTKAGLKATLKGETATISIR